MGRLGAGLVPQRATILTHCNAGGLATAGYGTALGVVRAAVEAGKTVRVLADETRPFLQGARLTAWELMEDAIDTVLITDGMAGSLMRLGEVDLVVVGAGTHRRQRGRREQDRDLLGRGAREGERDSLLRRRALSTIDLACPSGDADPDRGARPRGGHRAAGRADRPRGSRRAQSGVRRDPRALRGGDRHRARDRARAVRDLAARPVRFGRSGRAGAA
jgi:methylthioribose-1-phosphate isomerase